MFIVVETLRNSWEEMVTSPHSIGNWPLCDFGPQAKFVQHLNYVFQLAAFKNNLRHNVSWYFKPDASVSSLLNFIQIIHCDNSKPAFSVIPHV